MSPGQHRSDEKPAASSGGWLPSVLLGALVAILVGVGLLGWFGRGDSGAAPTPSPTPTLTPTPTPTLTPTPTPTPSVTVTPSVTASPTATPSPTTSPTASPSASASPTPTRIPPSQLPAVSVLNQSGIRGEAARVADALREQGWRINGIGNWVGSVPSTTVYYPDGQEAAARQLAGDLGVDRTRPRVSGMRPDTLTVVITSRVDI
jgi:hypothetical protein